MPKVSVIVPVYNVEKYIERCAVSLFEQTLDDIEYIFVNDCTPDNSMEILHAVMQRYPDRMHQVKIVSMDRNYGQAMVRNAGVGQATGDYVIHCDSDDWVESDIYEKLYLKAQDSDADIVVCDFFHEYGERTEIERYVPITTPYECIESDKSPVWWTMWNRLTRRSLIADNDIWFISEINCFEDMCYMMRLYYYANRIEYVGVPLYHYNRANEASTLNIYSFSNKIEQKKQCYDYLERWFSEKGGKLHAIHRRKIALKDMFLSGCYCDLAKWKVVYPEVVPLVVADKSLKWGYRKCYALASKGFFMPMKLYMWLSRNK